MTDEELLAKFNSSNKKISDLNKVEVRPVKVVDPTAVRDKVLYLRSTETNAIYKGFMLTPEDDIQFRRINSVHTVSIKLDADADVVYYRGVPANYYSVTPEVTKKLKIYNALWSELSDIGKDRISAEFKDSYIESMNTMDMCYMYLTDGPGFVGREGKTIEFSPGVYLVRSKSKNFSGQYSEFCNATQKILSTNNIPLTGFINNIYSNTAQKTQRLKLELTRPQQYNFAFELENLETPFTIPQDSLANVKSLSDAWISLNDANEGDLDKAIVAMTAVKNHFAKLSAAKAVSDAADPYKD